MSNSNCNSRGSYVWGCFKSFDAATGRARTDPRLLPAATLFLLLSLGGSRANRALLSHHPHTNSSKGKQPRAQQHRRPAPTPMAFGNRCVPCLLLMSPERPPFKHQTVKEKKPPHPYLITTSHSSSARYATRFPRSYQHTRSTQSQRGASPPPRHPKTSLTSGWRMTISTAAI